MRNKEPKKQEMQRLLDHYNLAMPITDDMLEHIARRMGPIYSSVVKKTSRYALISAIITGLFFLVKKTGIPLTFVKIAAALAISIPVATVLYFSASWGKTPAAPLSYTVTIKPFTSSSLGRETGRLVTDRIHEKLNRLHNASYSRIAEETIIKGTPWALIGSIEKPDSSIHIFIKIINARTSQIIFITEEQVSSLSELDRAVDRICRRLPPLKGK